MNRLVLAAVLLHFLLEGGYGQYSVIPQACLDCICVVESNCNMPSPCCKWDVNSNSCGPFQIKNVYWTDAHQMPNSATGTDFQTCACDWGCSVNTVQAYMARYATQNLIGHTPTCEDFARIHNGGPNGWSCSCTDAYWARVQACLAEKGIQQI